MRKTIRLGGLTGTISLALIACATKSEVESTESLGTARSAVFANGNFETGTPGAAPPSWTVATYLNPGLTSPTVTRPNLNLITGGTPLTTLLNSAAGAETQADPQLGAGASLRWPKYGNQVAIVNRLGASNNTNGLEQTMTIGAGDVDAVDGKIHVRFVVAPVLENPGHAAESQPYYWVQLTNLTTGTVVYQDFNASAQPGVPWKTSNGIYYTDWQLVDLVSKPDATISTGDQVKLEVIAAGCAAGGHWGHVYVDGVGSTIPGLFVSGSAPAFVAAGNTITYTLTYKNGSSVSASGVVVDFNMPPGTTFASLSAAGLSCTSPAVGAAGLVSCTIPGSVAAGGSGSFSVTAMTSAGAAFGSTVVAGNYSVRATAVSPLLGNKVQTSIGCATDAACGAGNWCQISTAECKSPLSNGTSLPTDAPHTSPTLNGVCTTAAATLVCTSKVCDAGDNKCGLANGSGVCTTANAATVCRSGSCSTSGKCKPASGCLADADCSASEWCNISTTTCTAKIANTGTMPTDTGHGTSPTLNGSCNAPAAALVCVSQVCDSGDNKCGLANGTGTCTSANAGTVCRSGSCSTNGKCKPVGGCLADTDCSASEWCNISTTTCTAKIANAGSMPTDTGHGTSPTLNGTCSTAAASLVCVSQVCDSGDNKCGLANGSGTCSSANAGMVCRSGSCSTTGKCKPAGGCLADADCSASQWCNISSTTCVAKIANNGGMPTDPGHGTSPTLNATCNVAAATLVCESQVCESGDNKCGFANGTSCVSAGQCRSSVCFAGDTKCGKPAGDACAAATECRSNDCDPAGFCAGDTDGDGVSDGMERSLGTDPLKKDSDGDGVADNVELSTAGDGQAPFSAVDSDGDGKMDALDTDDDNDGVLTINELGVGGGGNARDTDGDGKKDYLDADDDNDSILTKDELGAGGAASAVDSDMDGKADYLDADDDNDSILTKDELGGAVPSNSVDTDSDGKKDYLDADDDNDGVATKDELGAGGGSSAQDTDSDGKKDYLDADDDNDGVTTKDELGAGGAASAQDTDSDGKKDYLDADDDNDTLLTKDELGAGGGSSPQDTDGDGKQNYLDADDDNDSIPTKTEIADAMSARLSDDVDGDGKLNYLDTDADDDGILDGSEPIDTNGDGTAQYLQMGASVIGPVGGSLMGGGCNAASSSSSSGGLGALAMMIGLALLNRKKR